MRKLQFKGTPNFPGYHSHQADFEDGEMKEVPDDVADYLLTDFSEYFTEVKEVKKPVKDKMMRKAKTRGLK